MYSITTLRGTMFYTPLRYTKEFVASLGDIVDGFIPAFVRDPNALPMFQLWQLESPDQKELLAFNGDKIDLLKQVEGELDDAAIAVFAECCKAVFGKIMDVTGNNPSPRVALAPTVVVANNGARPEALYARLFSAREFNHTPLDTSNLSQVYRVEKSIGGKDIKLNHVANFHADSQIINLGAINNVRERYLCDFDINTMANPDYKFDKAGMEEFFSMSAACFVNFYNYYFAE